MNDISYNKFIELQKKGYSLDIIFLLMQMKDDVDVSSDSEKVNSLITTIMRKGLATEENKITISGQQLIDFITTNTKGSRIVKKRTPDEIFDKFWNAFPPSDTFTYKGVKFQGSRALRINKENCRTKLNAILNEGEHSIDTIVEAIKEDVKSKTEMSLKTRINKLSYMQNSLTYLNQRSYEPYILLLSEGTTIKESNEQVIGSTDI